jgi:hypothetical protein
MTDPDIRRWPISMVRAGAGAVKKSDPPIVMLWGPSGVMIDNDAYAEFAGRRHPQLLGSDVLEGRPKVVDPTRSCSSVLDGGGMLAYRDQHLILSRNGQPEDLFAN